MNKPSLSRICACNILSLTGCEVGKLKHIRSMNAQCLITAVIVAGGRWRCLQYWLRRTRLNLALLEQLDLIGRTAELARAFGIDFFSVLSRGSQYRVESMMVRLAHTQNYLMLSPAKEQVAPLAPALLCLLHR